MNDTLRAQIGILYDKYLSWRMVGAELSWEAADRGIIDDANGHADQYGSLANAVHRGAAKDSPTLRRVLGLPPRTVPVPPCAECGKVHTRHKLCDDEREPRTRHRVSLECDTAEDAAALRRIFDAHGKRREVGHKLATGELVLTKGECDERR